MSPYLGRIEFLCKFCGSGLGECRHEKPLEKMSLLTTINFSFLFMKGCSTRAAFIELNEPADCLVQWFCKALCISSLYQITRLNFKMYGPQIAG